MPPYEADEIAEWLEPRPLTWSKPPHPPELGTDGTLTWDIPDPVRYSESMSREIARIRPDRPPLTIVKASRTLLGGFLALAHSSDEAIHRYASRWGPLELSPKKRESQPDELEVVEDTSDWRDHARVFSDVLSIHAAIRSEQTTFEGRAHDTILRLAFPHLIGVEPVPEVSHDRETTTAALELAVGTLIHFAKISPSVFWEKSLGQLRVIPVPLQCECLRQALLIRLLSALTVPMYSCHYCGSLFSSRRKPREDKHKFCPPCRDRKVPQLLAKQRYRIKLRKEPRGGKKTSKQRGIDLPTEGRPMGRGGQPGMEERKTRQKARKRKDTGGSSKKTYKATKGT